jgi:energy-converting hydrogenase A subunit M
VKKFVEELFVDELRDVIHTKTFFVGDGVIKYLAKELNLQITKFVDVTSGRNGKSVSVNDMAQRIVKEDFCERASFFSAHALPSVEAQRWIPESSGC